MFVDWVSSKYLKRARNSLIMCRSRKPFEVKKEKNKRNKRDQNIPFPYNLFPGYFHLCFVCFILGWLSATENAWMKIKRLLSKHLAPHSAKVSGSGVLMICFVVSFWIWCWIFWLLVIYKNLLHKQREGGLWVWRLANIRNSFILLRGYSCGRDETACNQLPADSTLLSPRRLQDTVGFWSPTEQFWWLLSFHLIDIATFKISSGTREIPDEQGKAEELQRSLKKSFRSVCCAQVHSGFGFPVWIPCARS